MAIKHNCYEPDQAHETVELIIRVIVAVAVLLMTVKAFKDYGQYIMQQNRGLLLTWNLVNVISALDTLFAILKVQNPQWLAMILDWVHWFPLIWFQYLLFRLKSLQIYLDPRNVSSDMISKQLNVMFLAQVVCTIFVFSYDAFNFIWIFCPVEEWLCTKEAAKWYLGVVVVSIFMVSLIRVYFYLMAVGLLRVMRDN